MSLVSINRSEITDTGHQIYWRAIDSSIKYNAIRRQEYVEKQKLVQHQQANSYTVPNKKKRPQQHQGSADGFYWSRAPQQKHQKTF